MIEFTVGEFSYRAGKLPAMQQFHVVRRILPVVTKLGDLFSTAEVQSLSAMGPGEMDGGLLRVMAPIIQAISELPDTDCNYVIAACLSVVQRKQSDTVYVPVWSPKAGSPMFDDLDLIQMLTIVVHVLQGALSGFFRDALPNSPPPP